jgi:protease PrsW
MFLGLLLIAPVVLLYFLVIKGVDRYEPEPWWLLIACFVWGALGATFFAIIGNEIGGAGVQLALNVDQTSQMWEASTATFVAPVVEESTKGVALLLVWLLSSLWLKELDGALDGAIYGGIIGLGFTLTEDVLYVGSATAQGGAAALVATYIVRTVLAGLGHASFTAMTGLGVGIAAESRSIAMKVVAPVGGWMAAVGLHFLHNFLVTFLLAGGWGLLAKLLVFWTFDCLLFVLLFVLVLRDRAIVLRGLAGEVGTLLHPREFQRTTSRVMLVPLYNFFSLLGADGGYLRARRKQLDLVELAFLKRRRARGESGLERSESELRARIAQANAQGVFVGNR